MRWILLALLLGALCGAVYWASVALQDSLAGQRYADRIASLTDLDNWIGDTWTASRGEMDELKQNQAMREKLSREATLWFFVSSLAAILLAIWLGFIMGQAYRVIALTILAVALVAIVVGVWAPALMISASKKWGPFPEILLYYECRGILRTIYELIRSGNWLVGAPLFVFSILLPVAKTLTMGWVLARPRRSASRAIRFFHAVGKWSMADVFVVSLLLSFMGASHDDLMSARLLPGTLFFGIYAVLSILATPLVMVFLNKTTRSAV